MPNLSPSREAVERTREDILRRFERMPSSDDVRDMLAAAYAIDVAPLVRALEIIGESDVVGAHLARAVLARSQEPQK